MHNRQLSSDTKTRQPELDLAVDTARWTSSAYDITFGKIFQLQQRQADESAFRLSAWGLSSGLTHLLDSYSDVVLRSAFDTLIIRQNAHAVLMLNDVLSTPNSDFNFDLLDQIFITIDAEVFLPKGLRMHVTCITNITQVSPESDQLDKFVAIVDPGEARLYVRERRGMTIQQSTNNLH